MTPLVVARPSWWSKRLASAAEAATSSAGGHSLASDTRTRLVGALRMDCPLSAKPAYGKLSLGVAVCLGVWVVLGAPFRREIDGGYPLDELVDAFDKEL